MELNRVKEKMFPLMREAGHQPMYGAIIDDIIIRIFFQDCDKDLTVVYRAEKVGTPAHYKLEVDNEEKKPITFILPEDEFEEFDFSQLVDALIMRNKYAKNE